MIPEKLQDCLITELKQLFKDAKYTNFEETLSEINIFKQDPPSKKYEDDPDVKFPFVVVELPKGEIASEADPHTCSINFIIGMADLSDDGSGYSAVCSAINKIYYLLVTKKTFNKQFELDYPINWEIVKDDSDPFYYGAVTTNWIIPKITQSDKEFKSWL